MTARAPSTQGPKDPKCGPPPFSPKVAILTEKTNPGGAAETVAKGLVYQKVAILTGKKNPGEAAETVAKGLVYKKVAFLTGKKKPGGAADHSPRG